MGALKTLYVFVLAVALALFLTGMNAAAQDSAMAPLIIAGQGSFFVGGTTVTAPGIFERRLSCLIEGL